MSRSKATKVLSDTEKWWRDHLTKTLAGGVLAVFAFVGWFVSQSGKVDGYYLGVPYSYSNQAIPDFWRSWWLLVFGTVAISVWATSCIAIRRRKIPLDCDCVTSIENVRGTCYLIAYAVTITIAGLVGFDASHPKHQFLGGMTTWSWLMIIYGLAYPPVLVETADWFKRTDR